MALISLPKITLTRLVLLFFYLMTLFFCVLSLAVTIDEYEGGDRVAEFGSELAGFFAFPLFTISEMFKSETAASEISGGQIFALLILNLLVNCFLFIAAADFLIRKARILFRNLFFR